jgi:peptide/nickel transport system permease protein
MKPKLYLPAAVLLFWVIVSIFAPLMPVISANDIHLDNRLEKPSGTYLLGTDELGRDLLSRLAFGSRLSLKLTVICLALSLIMGGFLGGVAGFSGGLFDFFISRTVELLLAIPGILLAILILAFFRRGEYSLVLALTLTSWVGYARTARAVAMGLKKISFVEASVISGAGRVFIWKKHLFPNTFPVLSAQATVGAASIIMAEAGLSFLGLGVPPPSPSLGGILSNGCDYMIEAPHIVAFTSIYLMALLWSLYQFSDELRTLKA